MSYTRKVKKNDCHGPEVKCIRSIEPLFWIPEVLKIDFTSIGIPHLEYRQQ